MYASTQAPPQLSRWAGTGMILFTLLGWSSIPLFLRHFATSDYPIDYWTANGWRYGISALIWLPVIFHYQWRGKFPRGLWRAALVPGILNTAAQVCFAVAPYMIGPGLMTFSLRFQIVFLTVGAAILFPAERKIIRSAGYIGGMSMVILGTIGTVLLQEGGLGGGTAAGVILSIGAGLLYASYSLAVRHFMHGLPSLVAFAAVSQYTAAAIIILMLIFGKDHGAVVLHMPPREQLLVALSAVIGIGLGHTMYFASIARLGLVVSSGVVQLQPIAVSIGSYFLFGERLTPGQWACGLGAVLGAGVMLIAQHRIASRERLTELEPAAGEGAVETEDAPAPFKA